MSRVKPSFWLFVINKTQYGNSYYRSSVLVIVPLLFLGVGVTISNSPSSVSSYLPLIIFSESIIFILGTGIALFLHWKKFQQLVLIFGSGAETVGNILDVYFSHGSGYITYEYEYQQEQYRSTDTIMHNRKTKNIAVGQKVVLYVNQEKPSQAFIRDFYLNTF